MRVALSADPAVRFWVRTCFGIFFLGGGAFFLLVFGLCACFLSSSDAHTVWCVVVVRCYCGGVVLLWWCFCGGVVVFCGGVLWWCFCAGVFVLVFLCWCFCAGVFVLVFLCWCFCAGVFVLVFVWWCLCGGVFVVVFLWCGWVVFLWWCFCGGVCVVMFLWWCGWVVFLWWCLCGGVSFQNSQLKDLRLRSQNFVPKDWRLRSYLRIWAVSGPKSLSMKH